MQRIREREAEVLSKEGIRSVQLVSGKDSPSPKAVLTKVTVEPGGFQDRHRHLASEQVWIVLEGSATLLLENGKEEATTSGEVVRFLPGELHGVRNDGEALFVYISVTSPPENFEQYYDQKGGRR